MYVFIFVCGFAHVSACVHLETKGLGASSGGVKPPDIGAEHQT